VRAVPERDLEAPECDPEDAKQTGLSA